MFILGLTFFYFFLVDLVESLGMLQIALEISHRTITSHTHTDKITLTHPISNFELFMMLDIDWVRVFFYNTLCKLFQ